MVNWEPEGDFSRRSAKNGYGVGESERGQRPRVEDDYQPSGRCYEEEGSDWRERSGFTDEEADFILSKLSFGRPARVQARGGGSKGTSSGASSPNQNNGSPQENSAANNNRAASVESSNTVSAGENAKSDKECSASAKVERPIWPVYEES